MIHEWHDLWAEPGPEGRSFQGRAKQDVLRAAPMDGFTASLDLPSGPGSACHRPSAFMNHAADEVVRT
jgi:hypothetical protein